MRNDIDFDQSTADPLFVLLRRAWQMSALRQQPEVGRACPSGLLCSRMANLGEEEADLAIRHQGYPHYCCR
jgi:hypothetical protein